MRAWQIAGDLFRNAKPVIRQEEEQTWTSSLEVSRFYDGLLNLDWSSQVPGSGAPEKIMVASIQALENRGYRVGERGYRLLEQGLRAHADQDMVALHKISAQLRTELLIAQKDESSPYWGYHYYTSFEEYESKVSFGPPVPVDVTSDAFREQIHGAWLSQLIGGAMGTMVEGYTHENLEEAFGPIHGYLREPNTYNDDITYELAFLEAFREKGYEVASRDIALCWVGRIPCGWSAEECALRNLKMGILPPESGTFDNPFNEWIGAQMKGGICGMAAPGDAHMAARLAWSDGEIAHANNGILGEVFNAVLTSLAFIETSVRALLEQAIRLIPEDSEYRSVLTYAWDSCARHGDWRQALSDCMERYKKYNWIHAYPNACCEVIALYYGDGDYQETLHIVTMCGVDVDCNAAMIMPVLAIQKGMGIIPKKLIHPAFSTLVTYMRGYEEVSLERLVDDTLDSIRNAKKKEERL